MEEDASYVGTGTRKRVQRVKMSTLDKFISFMSINNENDEAGDEYDDEYDTEEEPYAPRRKGAAQSPRREEEEELSEYVFDQ